MDKLNSREIPLYFDYNATTPLAQEVIKGISDSLETDWANPSSLNSYSVTAKSAINSARKQIADMINCSASEVIFMSGGTEANNTVIYGISKYFEEHKRLKKNCLDANNWINLKPNIITSNVEHDSVILPIRYLENIGVITVSVIQVNSKGSVNVDDVFSKITDSTCLITIMYANNETGVIMPISDIGQNLQRLNVKRKKENKVRILFHTDAAQIIGKEKVDFQELCVDYLTVVGHKFYGPRIGCLCAKASVYPLLFGGGQERNLRPGTENTPMIVGLGVAAELVRKNLEKYKTNMLKCRNELEKRLKEEFGKHVTINFQKSPRLPNTSSISFQGEGLDGNSILENCRRLIASVGAACHTGKCSQILINSGLSVQTARNTIRMSVGRTTTLEDVEEVILDLKSAVSKVKGKTKLII